MAPASTQTAALAGAVQDASTGALNEALIRVLTAHQAVVAMTTTDASGRFTIIDFEEIIS